MAATVRYRKLRGYKYQLVAPYTHRTSLSGSSAHSRHAWIVLQDDGLLRLRKGYAWDGPSGPLVDTKNLMRGSLVHDALYQLMRESLLSIQRRREVDQLLREILLEDGMSRIRASLVYWAVRSPFGARAARPRPIPPVLTAPDAI